MEFRVHPGQVLDGGALGDFFQKISKSLVERRERTSIRCLMEVRALW
jgi:hypothetical protein